MNYDNTDDDHPLKNYEPMLFKMGFEDLEYVYEMTEEYACPECLGIAVKVMYDLCHWHKGKERKIQLEVSIANLSYVSDYLGYRIGILKQHFDFDIKEQLLKGIIMETQATVETKLKHILRLERIA